MNPFTIVGAIIVAAWVAGAIGAIEFRLCIEPAGSGKYAAKTAKKAYELLVKHGGDQHAILRARHPKD